jgi:hypothetical protein
MPTEDQMPETFPAMPAEFLASCGLTVPDDEREGLLAALGSMHALAGSLYTVEGARYIDPAFGWTPVV